MKIFFLIILLAGLFFPLVSFGASYNAYEAGGKTVIYEGLVPCGKEVCIFNLPDPAGLGVSKDLLEILELAKKDDPSVPFKELCTDLGGKWKSTSCQFCHLFVMLFGIINFILFGIVPVLAVLMLVVGGVMFFFAGTNPNALKTAKGIITSVVIGLVIIFAAYVIVGAVLQAIGLAEWSGKIYESWWEGNFFKIDCPVQLPK